METLLRRFNCDRNGFKSKFLSVKPQVDEDFGTYTNRAKRYFDRWTELSAVTSKDQLEFLICSEIALQACEPEFVSCIKDRTPANLCELKAVATAYVNARPNKSFAKKSEPVSFVVNSSHALGKAAPPRNNWNAQDAEGGHAYLERNRFGSTRTRSNDRGAYGSRSLSRDRSFKPDNQYSYRKGNSGDLICYRCHGYGHTKKFCLSFKLNSRRKDGHNANNLPRLRVDMLQRRLQ
ncbi:SCAN domain-containing protein 3 [Elysia marginata]|uniref:SCAN domain-containing protein 3 n=1 Tax=Elysia marginata TaxID=1093978 RepID=A0AAV4FWX4_9GAST|nr:SCAN domain-containing protein 3 [Elysia marginata]